MSVDSLPVSIHVHFPNVLGKLSRACLIGTSVPLLKACWKTVVTTRIMQTRIMRVCDSMAIGLVWVAVAQRVRLLYNDFMLENRNREMSFLNLDSVLFRFTYVRNLARGDKFFVLGMSGSNSHGWR